MLFDFLKKGSKVNIERNEYIVLNKINENGEKYIFVANVKNPEIDLSENFDLDALNLLLLSTSEREEMKKQEENYNIQDAKLDFNEYNSINNNNNNNNYNNDSEVFKEEKDQTILNEIVPKIINNM